MSRMCLLVAFFAFGVLCLPFNFGGVARAAATLAVSETPSIIIPAHLPVKRPARLSPIDKTLQSYYSSPQADPVWLRREDGMLRVRALISAIEQAPRHGLRAKADDLIFLRPIAKMGWKMPSKRPDAMALDRKISAIYLRYVNQLVRGIVEPGFVEASVYLEPLKVDPFRMLAGAEKSTDIKALFTEISPSSPRYRRLQFGLKNLRARYADGGWGPKVEADSLRPGDEGKAVLALRQRLKAMGDLRGARPQQVETPAALYDSRLRAGVMRFQQRHGLEANGIADTKTMIAINRSIDHRMTQILIGLERMRWYRHRLSGRRIEVNLPEYRLRLIDESDIVRHRANVIIGQEPRFLQTPEFMDSLRYLVLNPSWTVPHSILQRTFLPQLRKDAAALDGKNMILLEGNQRIDPKAIDWSKETASTVRRFTLIQRPGAQNALGAVKFMFPNSHNIYLHDTPDRSLFAKDQRTFSHGCVRVERPMALAWALLEAQTDKPGELIETLLEQGTEQAVPLEQPVPIRLLYFTAWVDEAGLLHFRDDIYDRDKALVEALNRIES